MRMLKLNPLKIANFIKCSFLANQYRNKAIDHLVFHGEIEMFHAYYSRADYYKQEAEKNRSYGIIQRVLDRII